ncbi:sigma-70 family RNA polymerase sigma factor [Salipaludibacillus daqingensis]|uniref:sigma-70 family RNA polymerase sigma factor n=1 Tax=Salipaludibacillus daqingensis TaxID=3041001 RepID=UPI00247410A2|nr:sigma-70 family RNA polymerase sigma factor [Salipaludibacillus daqingensis]
MAKQNEKLEDIYLTHAKSLYYYLLQLSGSPEVAEDLLQDTFLKATISLNFYKNDEVKSWLFKVARHAYFDYWRKRKRWEWVPFVEKIHNKDQVFHPYETPESFVIEKESSENIKTVYGFMPENYRTILFLREDEKFSYEQLAETLEISENQVKVTLHRARKRFEELVQQYF